MPINFSDLKQQETIKFTSTAPNRRVVGRGLNLEGVCLNEECEAFNEKIWLEVGFGVHSLNEIIT